MPGICACRKCVGSHSPPGDLQARLQGAGRVNLRQRRISGGVPFKVYCAIEIEKREDLWYNKISTNRKLVKTKMIINIDYDLKGSILDIGGGGEAIIGQMYDDRVTAIDNRQEELDEAPNCCTKLLMDAEKLSFFDGSFDNVTFFYTLMYMSEEIQRKAIFEAARVLKTGGIMCIWDCTISSAYPEPFVVDLDIQFTDKRIHTSYGIVKLDPQSSNSISQLLKNAGLNIVSLKEESGQFNITCRKD